MRQMQDEEYQESLEADRRRELEAAEEEQRRQQEQELAETVALSVRLSAEDCVRKRRARLPPELEATLPTTAVVRFQLPRGTKVTRRFDKADTAVAIYDFLTVHFADTNALSAAVLPGEEQLPAALSNFSVSTHFPMREVRDTEEATVQSLGLFPRGMLFVVDADA
jgi:FAS-associated factor 2